MKLHEQRDYWKEIAGQRLECIMSLLNYVESDKFQFDRNVNSGDIILRIREHLGSDYERPLE